MISKIKEVALFISAVFMVSLGGKIYHNHHYVSLVCTAVGVIMLGYYWERNED